MGRDVEGMILAIEGYLEEGREKEAKQSVLELKELLLLPHGSEGLREETLELMFGTSAEL